jgi:hypothetical protein
MLSCLIDGRATTITHLAREYDEVSNLLENATQDHRRAYYTVIFHGMTAELNAKMPAGSSILVPNAANAFMNVGSAFDSSVTAIENANGGTTVENANGGVGGTTENAFE